MQFSQKEYLAELRPLIDVDCGSFQKPGLRVVSDILAEKYRQLNWHVEIKDLDVAGRGVLARNKPEAENIDLLLMGHTDTDFPAGTVENWKMEQNGNKLTGPGTCDMKAGLLNFVYALRSCSPDALDKLSIAVLMNPDGEIGCIYSFKWIKSVAKISKAAIVGESGRIIYNSLVKARSGMARYEVAFKGKAAHAGNDPEDGRSAISELGQWIVCIDKMADSEKQTTVNVGFVTGGTGSNVVADHARADIDIRFKQTSELIRIDKALSRMAEKPHINGITVTIERTGYFPALEPTDASFALMKRMELAGLDTDYPVNWLAVCGPCDAGHISELGIPFIDAMGPVVVGDHSSDKFLLIDTIEPKINLLRQFIENLARDPIN